jgi:hypothetical protein
MSKFFKTMATVLAIAAFAAVAVSCSKDEENDELVGRWVYSEGNYDFLYEGEWYNAKEEGFDLSGFNSSLRGTYFVFEKNGTLTLGFGGQSASGTYSVSGSTINMTGSYSVPMEYRIYDGKLELTWSRSTIEIMGVSMDELYELGVEDVEMTLTFTRN